MSRSNGKITLTCGRCKGNTVEVSVSGMVRGPESTPVRALTIYPRVGEYGWMFVDGEGDICNDCLTDDEWQSLARDLEG